jgi:hypothetical protein
MPASTAPLPFAYEVLYERLRQEGFRLGVDHQLRVQELLSLAAVDALHVGPADLKTLLCPVFATNRAQQEAFYRVFDEVHTRVEALAKTRAAAQAPVERKRPGIWENLARPWAPSVFFGLALVGLFWSLRPPAQELVKAPEPPQTQPVAADAIMRTREFSIDATKLPRPKTPHESRPFLWTAVAAPLLAFGAFALSRAAGRRVSFDRQSGLKPPHYWPLKLESLGSKLYPSAAIRQLAARMRRRQDGPDGILDIPATITATIRRAGFLRFLYRSSRRPPEYIVLIERQSVSDHFTALIGDLTRLLQADGVHLARYYFDHDPYRITSEKGDDLLLADLAGATPSHRLLAFGSSGTFLHPVTGRVLDWAEPALEKWPMRAMLVEDAPSRRRVSRLQDEAGLCVVPASLGGLCEAMEFFDSGGTIAGRPFPKLVPLAPPLAEDSLDPSIAACAIYPELNWNLTLRLTNLGEAKISRLSRMPWFRLGEIPPPLREDLVAAVPESARPALQQSLVSLLESQTPPKDTFAWENWQSVLRLYGPERRSWWQPRAEPVAGQDFVFLRFLDGRPKGAFSFLADWMFESGIRSLGTRTVAWLPITAMLSAGLAAALQPWQDHRDPGARFIVKGRVVDEAAAPVVGVDVGGFVSDANGRFQDAGLLVDRRGRAKARQFVRVTTSLWPRSAEVTGAGEILVRVGRTRLRTGPRSGYGIQQQGAGFLINFEGGSTRLSVGPEGQGTPLDVVNTNDGVLVRAAVPGRSYRVEIDGAEYGRFTMPGTAPVDLPVILSFTGRLADIPSRALKPVEGVQLTWSIKGAETARIDEQEVDAQKGSAFRRLQPSYTLVAENSAGSVKNVFRAPPKPANENYGNEAPQEQTEAYPARYTLVSIGCEIKGTGTISNLEIRQDGKTLTYPDKPFPCGVRINKTFTAKPASIDIRFVFDDAKSKGGREHSYSIGLNPNLDYFDHPVEGFRFNFERSKGATAK